EGDGGVEAQEGGVDGAGGGKAARRRRPEGGFCGGGQEGGGGQGRDAAVLPGQTRREAAGRRHGGGAADARRPAERPGQGAAGLLRGVGARACGTGHGRARGRARQAPEGSARPEAEPRLGIVAQRGPRQRQDRDAPAPVAPRLTRWAVPRPCVSGPKAVYTTPTNGKPDTREGRGHG